jgi:hypothetical protein
MSESEWKRFLAEHECYGEQTDHEYVARRKSDGKRVTSYAVSHGGKKKNEVLDIYRRNFLKGLERLKDLDKESLAEQTHEEKTESYKDSDWYKQQQDWHSIEAENED